MINDECTMRERLRDLVDPKDPDLDKTLSPEHPTWDQLVEQISQEAESLAAAHRGPTRLLQCLQELGCDPLLPLAAERHYHATINHLEESNRHTLVHRSPIVALSRKHLLLAPVGPLDAPCLDEVEERLQRALLRAKANRVTLCLDGLMTDEETVSKWISRLETEFRERKISLQVQRPAPPSK